MPRNAQTQAPPAPQQVIPPAPTTPPAVPSPAPAPVSPTASWPTPFQTPAQPEPTDTTPKARRSRGGRGMPVGPVLAGTGNAAALTLTGALQYGGPVAAATTGALMAAGATAVALRKRAANKRSMASRSGARGPLRGAGGGGSRGAAGASRTGAGGALRSAKDSGRGGSRGATGRGAGGATGAGSGRGVAPGKSGATGSASGTGGALKGATTRGGGGLLGAGRGATGTGLLGGGKNRHGSGSGSGRHGDTPATGPRHSAGPRHTSAAGTGSRSSPGGAGHPTKSNKGRVSSTIKAALGRAGRASGRLISRGAAAGGKKMASLAKAATAGLVRQVKKVPGALTDGLLAGTAGLLSGLWHRSFRAGWDRVRDVWRKLRARRARKKAENTPDTPASTPPVGATVRRPLSATFTQPTPQGGTLMSGGHHFVAPAMEMARIAANYQPQGMLQVGEDFAGLSEALALHAEAMKTTVENADASWPLEPGIVDLMREIYSLQIKAAELALELQPAFEQLHGVDLERLRNPRKGAQAEAMWDVRTNL